MLMNPCADEMAQIIIEEGVQVVTTGAGSPGKYIPAWKEAGIKVLPVVAASILAKVSRDRFMLEMAERYPQYGFERHKGYGTRLHYEMLRRYGPSPIHRRTFLKDL